MKGIWSAKFSVSLSPKLCQSVANTEKSILLPSVYLRTSQLTVYHHYSRIKSILKLCSTIRINRLVSSCT